MKITPVGNTRSDVLKQVTAQFVDSTKINGKTRAAAFNAIYPFLSGQPQDEIPIGSIFDALEGVGLHAMQEDGTPWSGFLTGRDGSANIQLGIKTDEGYKEVSNATLFIQWHKFDTGRYEVIGYIS